MKNIALILASGTGRRSGFDIPKQFMKISTKTIFEMSVRAFQKNELVDEVYVVVAPDFVELAQSLLAKSAFKKIKKVVVGGATRKESSLNGIFAIDESEANVLIHDCVRPFVTQKIINGCIAALESHSAVDVAVPVVDTIFVCENNVMKLIPQRSTLKQSQTPQCFKLSLIKKAHSLALENEDDEFTDDCGLILKYALAPIYVIDGDKNNIKITYAQDFEIAKLIEKNENDDKG